MIIRVANDRGVTARAWDRQILKQMASGVQVVSSGVGVVYDWYSTVHERYE